ncbi:Protein with carboxyl methyl esterase activity [Serendipita sp. 407]|nr:Protein with carboxyl methyl esterase activity [Serendipita sp. 407]
MQARIAKLPYLPTIAPQYHDADDVEEREEAMSTLAALPKMLPPGPRESSRRTALRQVDAPDLSQYSPISASGYFVQAMNVKIESRGIDVRAYYSPPVVQDPAASDEPTTVMVCHHGAGYSGLSFACFAKEVVEHSKGECGVLAFDVRRHGKTRPLEGQSDENLDIETLTEDLVELLTTLFPDPNTSSTLLFVGHSMGGAVCVRACPVLQEMHYKISGVAVLDVVEGSALDALPIMMGLLDSRPDGFPSVEEAIQWHINTHTLRNPFSARIAVPSIFVQSPDSNSAHEWVWRTPLRSTAPYWTSWFKSLSSKFLACRTARLLVLAGTDRLDKELMIGQMQGKFQMEVVPDVGHMLHEDNPRKIAQVLVEFWKRNERVVIGVKKVGEL